MIRRLLARLGLLGAAARLRDAWRFRGAPESSGADAAGVAIPGPRLIYNISGHTDVADFLRYGESTMAAIISTLNAAGADFQHAARILDFGCGCGRLTRFAIPATRGEVWGSDIDAAAVAWCGRHLKGAFRVNRLAPPTEFPEGCFDIIYAQSVFTHLREETQAAWLREFKRIAKPDAHILVTFHDEHFIHCPEPVRRRLAREAFIADTVALEGSNRMAAFQSWAHFESLVADEFDILARIRSGESDIRQAAAVLTPRRA